MTTIVNNPTPTENNGYTGLIVGIIVIFVAGYIFMVFGLPAIRNMQVPAAQINIPDKINVNIEQTK